MPRKNRNKEVKKDSTRKQKIDMCDEYEIIINGKPKIYTIIQEIDLAKMHPKFYIEDWDDEKDHWGSSLD